MMVLLASLWDEGSFTLREDVAYGTIACANWPLESLHQIGATVHVLMDLSIDAALAADQDTNLLETFYSTNVEL